MLFSHQCFRKEDVTLRSSDASITEARQTISSTLSSLVSPPRVLYRPYPITQQHQSEQAHSAFLTHQPAHSTQGHRAYTDYQPFSISESEEGYISPRSQANHYSSNCVTSELSCPPRYPPRYNMYQPVSQICYMPAHLHVGAAILNS